ARVTRIGPCWRYSAQMARPISEVPPRRSRVWGTPTALIMGRSLPRGSDAAAPLTGGGWIGTGARRCAPLRGGPVRPAPGRPDQMNRGRPGPARRGARGRGRTEVGDGAGLPGDRSHTAEGGVVTIRATAARRIMAGSISDASVDARGPGPPSSVTPGRGRV